MTQRPEPLSARFLKARMRRQWPTVREVAHEFLSRKPDSGWVLRAMARLGEELGNRGDALAYWKQLRAMEPNDFEAAFHVARAIRDDGASLDDAVASVSANLPPAFADNLRAVLSDPPDTAGQQLSRNVMICGVSYSGSTLFDRLLGSLPGAASIGESHWLVKSRSVNGGFEVLDFGRDFTAEMVKCSVCRDLCPVLTADFRRALAADRRNWYFRIAERLRTQTLIACDKNPLKIVDNDPLLRLDALVLFKSLPQAWWSELKLRKSGQDETYYLAECKRYVTTWCENYAIFLDSFVPDGKVVFVSFEEFARAPSRVLRAACKGLSLPFDESVLKSARRGHAIGGNAAALRRLASIDYAPDITPLETPPLPESHSRVIAESAEAKRIFDLLQSAHDHTMQH